MDHVKFILEVEIDDFKFRILNDGNIELPKLNASRRKPSMWIYFRIFLHWVRSYQGSPPWRVQPIKIPALQKITATHQKPQ